MSCAGWAGAVVLRLFGSERVRCGGLVVDFGDGGGDLAA